MKIREHPEIHENGYFKGDPKNALDRNVKMCAGPTSAIISLRNEGSYRAAKKR